jgi:4-hydroxy 2-oxovalerate aldolase
MRVFHLDCTLRDGGYYNSWDFEADLIASYLEAMVALKVDFVEIGLRSVKNSGFKGGFAYSTDAFLKSLPVPIELQDKIGVMINASELIQSPEQQIAVLEKLFAQKSQSPVTLVRIASHVHEFADALPAAVWLKEKGYMVGFNLMQIADCSDDEIISLAQLASEYPIDTLYFADSMGSLNPVQVKHIVGLIQQGWSGDIGIHTHDNMNQALANSMAAVEAGVTWIDSTVTGMGRGPGNVQTEYLALALAPYRQHTGNTTKLLELTRKHFKPMQEQFGWGTNPYYYLAGQYGIHPTYIQHMLSDNRFTEEDILAVIDHLKVEGGKSFSHNTLDAARQFYSGEPRGKWQPKSHFKDQEVLLLGTGPGVAQHRQAIEYYIQQHKPIVLALNTQSSIAQELIDLRVACHPIRLLADCDTHVQLPQPLITPASMLPQDVLDSLKDKKLLDFGLKVLCNTFEITDYYCVIPDSLVLSYALAILSAGEAKRILLAGFDGYSADDPRQKEVEHVFGLFLANPKHSSILSITPSRYEIPVVSVYALENVL